MSLGASCALFLASVAGLLGMSWLLPDTYAGAIVHTLVPLIVSAAEATWRFVHANSTCCLVSLAVLISPVVAWHLNNRRAYRRALAEAAHKERDARDLERAYGADGDAMKLSVAYRSAVEALAALQYAHYHASRRDRPRVDNAAEALEDLRDRLALELARRQQQRELASEAVVIADD